MQESKMKLQIQVESDQWRVALGCYTKEQLMLLHLPFQNLPTHNEH